MMITMMTPSVTAPDVAGLRALATFDAGDVDKASGCSTKSSSAGGAYAANLHLLYGRLIHRAATTTPCALSTWTAPTRCAPVSGAASRSAITATPPAHGTVFQSVVGADVGNTDQESMMEYILAHYYLGDPERAPGLEIVLRGIQRTACANWACST